jgi:hypothetical protein
MIQSTPVSAPVVAIHRAGCIPIVAPSAPPSSADCQQLASAYQQQAAAALAEAARLAAAPRLAAWEADVRAILKPLHPVDRLLRLSQAGTGPASAYGPPTTHWWSQFLDEPVGTPEKPSWGMHGIVNWLTNVSRRPPRTVNVSKMKYFGGSKQVQFPGWRLTQATVQLYTWKDGRPEPGSVYILASGIARVGVVLGGSLDMSQMGGPAIQPGLNLSGYGLAQLAELIGLPQLPKPPST